MSENGRKAYQRLLNETTFALFGVGYGGETSKGELALDTLVEEKEAITALRSLVTKATPEGGIYALIGLKMLACDCFQEELIKYKKLPEPKERVFSKDYKIERGYLQTQSGCIVGGEKRSKVIQEVQTGSKVEAKIHNYKVKKQVEKIELSNNN